MIYTTKLHFYSSIQSKGWTISKANYGVLNSSKKQTKLTILSKEEAQDSNFWKNWGDHNLLSRLTDLKVTVPCPVPNRVKSLPGTYAVT